MASNSTLSKGGVPVEFINYESEINGNFKKYLHDLNFEKLDLNYSVLTILGCQSSGKSSLLNSLFGLKFDVMDTKRGHSQTTKGMWASLVSSNDLGATLVVDVEGTDSRERGEGRMTFEHRSALLCLALSDCVLINLWYHSLGNFAGSNYGLLKTVIEANLELQGDSKNVEIKTTLIFCIRDWFQEMAPLEIVREKILNEFMGPIWKDIQKPKRYAKIQLDQLFDIQIYGLGHALVNPEAFKKGVDKLLNDFKTNLRPKAYSRQIPADGFYQYACNIWNTIKDQGHLDIPTQREMLATFRCGEIGAAVLVDLDRKKAEGLAADNFEKWTAETVQGAIDSYANQANRYDERVCFNVGKKLVGDVFQHLQPIFEHHATKYCKEIIADFSTELERNFKITGKDSTLQIGGRKPQMVWPDFSKICQEMIEKRKALLAEFAKAHHLQVALFEQKVDGAFVLDNCMQTLESATLREVDLLKTRHLELLKMMIRVGSINVAENFQGVANDAFKVPDALLIEPDLNGSDYWNSVSNAISSGHKQVIATYATSYKGLLPTTLPNEFEHLVYLWLIAATRINLERVEQNITEYIFNRFESVFNNVTFKGEVMPRDWAKATEQELNSVYVEAKRQALAIVPVLMAPQSPKIKFPSFKTSALTPDHLLYHEFTQLDLEDNKSALTEQCLIQVKALCQQKFHELFRQARTIQSSGGRASWRNVPPVFWALLLFCGWNELWFMLRLFFKIQILIPIIIMVGLGLHACSNALLGERAKAIVDPLIDKAVDYSKGAVSWGVGQAFSLALKASSAQAASPVDPPDTKKQKVPN
ncbi:bifunctional P-loop containing nucleoside triphosphate hydrolase/GB1-RHD3-type guanine nucleotide-binding (G) domain/RHD3-Sey1 [Babesia duncani]|uniref:Protein SEY1 homolog n=1 Tax=Babesia duncani TaxID=323732 RepID=A0AAD9PP94_9APIC|nr:bifunctional P-loop containing nucleoside triphosphate hydrolase/GB1-RHD3-type guanine nucleotide-binding (G) domain/RHD3-Sey1 [Babesia duncani]